MGRVKKAAIKLTNRTYRALATHYGIDENDETGMLDVVADTGLIIDMLNDGTIDHYNDAWDLLYQYIECGGYYDCIEIIIEELEACDD